MAITVAFLDPALTAVLAGVRLYRFMDAKVLLEATDTSELLVTVHNFTGPDLVHSASSFVLLVIERVVFCSEGFKSFIPRLGWLLDLLALDTDKRRDRVSPLIASLRASTLKHLISFNTV